MKKKIFYIFLTLLTVINLTAFGFLFYNKFLYEKKPVERPTCIYYLKDTLNLSENQYCKMKECQCSFRDSMTNLIKSIRLKKAYLFKTIKDSVSNDTTILTLMNEIDSLQSVHLRSTVKNLQAHKKIMNREQSEKFFSMILEEYSVNSNNKNKHN